MSNLPLRPLRLAACAAVVTLVAAACFGGGDEGDPEAFCDLLVAGVGQADGDVQPGEFASLAEVAPSEISGAVEKLANTAADVETLDHTDLEALFAASFDPDATQARREFDAYATEECDIPVDQTRLEAEVTEFLAINFAEARWRDDIQIAVATDSGLISGIDANFVGRPLAGEATELCAALSVYLYEVTGADGPVTVNVDDKLLVSRQNREAPCQQP